MTVERAILHALEPTEELSKLLADIEVARSRALRADPADRENVVRFESLSTRLELLAHHRSVQHSPVADDEIALASSALAARGLIPVLVVSAHEPGVHGLSSEESPARPPAARWQSPNGERGRRAVELRFRAQIEESLATGGAHSIAPSGLQHSIVTEILREYVNASPPTPVEVPVEYRDGSRAAHPFALRSLQLSDEHGAVDLELRLALLSIRHVDMDATIDGAWMRNAEVSRPRPAAQTDDLVYRLSRQQLADLTAGRRTVKIVLYQTGLETAVVGFYRALVDHLLAEPASVVVQPMYFVARPRSAKAKARSAVAGHAPYRVGRIWADAEGTR